MHILCISVCDLPEFMLHNRLVTTTQQSCYNNTASGCMATYRKQQSHHVAVKHHTLHCCDVHSADAVPVKVCVRKLRVSIIATSNMPVFVRVATAQCLLVAHLLYLKPQHHDFVERHLGPVLHRRCQSSRICAKLRSLQSSLLLRPPAIVVADLSVM